MTNTHNKYKYLYSVETIIKIRNENISQQNQQCHRTDAVIAILRKSLVNISLNKFFFTNTL